MVNPRLAALLVAWAAAGLAAAQPVWAAGVTVGLTVPAAGAGDSGGASGAPLPQPGVPTTTAPTPEPDLLPPAAVANLAVASGDRRLVLTWRNPGDPDLAAVAIVRRDDRYPTGIGDGLTVQRSLAERATDAGLANGLRYYYAAFVVDSSGNVGPAALAAGIPLGPTGPGELPPSLPPALPDLPRVNPSEEIGLGSVQLLVNEGRTALVASAGAATALAGDQVTVFLPAFVLPKPASQVIVSISGENGEQLFMLPRRGDGGFIGSLQVPEQGSYGVSIRVRYADGTEDIIALTLAALPRGKVVDAATGERLANGAVTLWQRRGGRWVVWNEGVNPQLTAGDGSFGFVPGPGEYQLEVLRAGYRPWRRKVLADRGVVAGSIKLTPETSASGAALPPLPAAAVPVALATLVLILAQKLRRTIRDW